MNKIKRILILRHAEAGSGKAASDRDRPLTPNGLKDARTLGRFMAARGFKPDFVLCSPAERTRQTLKALHETLRTDAVTYPESLYNGPAGMIFEAVKEAEETARELLVIAHNPGVYNFVRIMAESFSEGLAQAIYQTGYPPGTLSVLELPDMKWQSLQPGSSRLSGFYPPSDYTVSPEAPSSSAF